MLSNEHLAAIQKQVDDYGRNHWLAKKVYTHLFSYPWHVIRMKMVCENMIGPLILDIACASGEFTEAIRKAVLPTRIVGLEGCLDVMNFGQKRYPKIQWIHGLVEDMQFSPKSFNSIHAGEIIEHVEDPEGLVEKLSRITRKRLVISTPKIVVGDPAHIRVYTYKAFHQLLSKHFTDVRIIDADHEL